MPDGIYLELVGSLCSTRLPAMIMTGLFGLVGTLAVTRLNGHVLGAILVLGISTSVCRLAIMFEGRRRFDAHAITVATARRFERSFAIFYLGFAALLGVFAADVAMSAASELLVPICIMVVGYAAGVAATMALRPRIAIPSLLLGVGPFTVTIGSRGTPEGIVSAACLLALLIGGFRSLDRRNRSQYAGAATRDVFARLARRDHLTGLGNRLELSEAVARLRQRNGSDDRIGIHYVDLDDFKPVNDRLGHLVGDALLKEIAERLRMELTDDDVAVRIGGDEFVFVQTSVHSCTDVTAKALRLEAVLDMPLRVNTHSLIVGASVGSSGPWPVDTDLDTMLEHSDRVLRTRKAKRKSRASVSGARGTDRQPCMVGS